MITLTGTLRQFGEVTFADKPDRKGGSFLKLWLEHVTPRDGDGPDDIAIQELLIPMESVPAAEKAALKPGGVVSVVVRVWAKGREVAFQAIRLVSGAAPLSVGAGAK